MDINTLVKQINAQLAGEMLTWDELRPFINAVIDEVNTHLAAKFPVLLSSDTEYTAIPEKFIRTVVIPGAAYKYYVMDEEGEQVASEFYARYYQALYHMLRDYGNFIPLEYQNDEAGYLEMEEFATTGQRGVIVSGENYQI